MADTLSFSLVSPASEVFSGEVDHVIAPGAEGEFGVLPNHAPFMTTLKNGVVRILSTGKDDMRVFVRGGFADVTPACFRPGSGRLFLPTSMSPMSRCGQLRRTMKRERFATDASL